MRRLGALEQAGRGVDEGWGGLWGSLGETPGLQGRLCLLTPGTRSWTSCPGRFGACPCKTSCEKSDIRRPPTHHHASPPSNPSSTSFPLVQSPPMQGAGSPLPLLPPPKPSRLLILPAPRCAPLPKKTQGHPPELEAAQLQGHALAHLAGVVLHVLASELGGQKGKSGGGGEATCIPKGPCALASRPGTRGGIYCHGTMGGVLLGRR